MLMFHVEHYKGKTMKFETAIKVLRKDAEFLGKTDFIEYLAWTNDNWLTAPAKVKQALDAIADCDPDRIIEIHGRSQGASR